MRTRTSTSSPIRLAVRLGVLAGSLLVAGPLGCAGGETVSQGQAGTNGAAGTTGGAGTTGDAGTTGTGGTTGMAGNMGTAGSTDPAGVAGTGGSANGGAGATGTAGTTGSGGSSGSTGTGGTTGTGGMIGTGEPSGCGREDCGTACTIPAMPAFAALPSITSLPDPFKMASGTAIARKSEWQCRRAEINAQFQNYETGNKNTKPPGAVTGTVSGSMLTVTVGGQSFSVTINSKPSGAGPHPLLISLSSSPVAAIVTPLGVASISFPFSTIANEGTGRGLFTTVTGSTDNPGSLIGWAWGVSRLIDAIEATPAVGIDPKRIAITGCSRYGKGALMVGAMDERIALVIPEEGGSGGSASWRVAYAEDATAGGTMTSHKVQTLDHAYGEQHWFGGALMQFGSPTNVNKLPVDHHELLGMVAPRGLLVLDSANAAEWLGVHASVTSGTAARTIYTALGVQDNMGYTNSQDSHCSSLDSTETAAVQAFVRRFLLNQTSQATKVWNIQKTAFGTRGTPLDPAKWYPWTVPTLQ